MRINLYFVTLFNIVIYHILYIYTYRSMNNSETSINKKRGRPRHQVWYYFVEIDIEQGEKKDKRPGAKCTFCDQKWARGKTSEMIAHLALSCPKPPPSDIRTTFIEILRSKSFVDDYSDEVDPSSKRLKSKQ